MRKKVRRRRADLIDAAVRLARLLSPEESILIGGLAVGVHGYVRATDDIDFICRAPLERTRERLREAGVESRLVRGHVLDRGFSCLKGEIDGIPFDILPPLVPIAWEGALQARLRGGPVRIVELEGLLRLKFRAGGPQDLLDAARLVLLHPAMEARARELATAYRALDRFELWLRDPRIRAQSREEAELERRRVRSRMRRRTTRARARQPRRPR